MAHRGTQPSLPIELTKSSTLDAFGERVPIMAILCRDSAFTVCAKRILFGRFISRTAHVLSKAALSAHSVTPSECADSFAFFSTCAVLEMKRLKANAHVVERTTHAG